MNAIHVTRHLDFGGVEKHMHTISKNNHLSKFQHSFIALERGGNIFEMIKSEGGDVSILSCNSRIPSIQTVIKLFWIFKQRKPDVVHTHGAEANFHGLIAAYLARVPVRIGEEIGVTTHSPIAKKVFKLVYRYSSFTIGITPQVVDRIIEMGEVEPEKTGHTYLPVDVSKGQTNGEKQKEFTICTVSRLTAVKNIALVIKAISQLNTKGLKCKLMIIGDGPDAKSLRDLAAKEKVSEQVTFYGYLQKPWELAKSAHLYALPSFQEGLGLSLVEAMLHKIPSVATNKGGTNELINHGESGWLIDPHNLNEFVRQIEEIVKLEPDQLEEITLNAYQNAFEICAPEAYLKRLDELYLKYMNASKC
jgi:glycosyltransferase involved in cell wall biosynthesis